MTLVNGVLFEQDDKTKYYGLEPAPVKTASKTKIEIDWVNALKFIVVHLAGLYGGYLFFTSAKWQTNVFAFLVYIMAGLGVTAGGHRLWTHRSYKAKWPLRLILIFLHTLSFQDPVIKWARDHRLHHKYSETDADPHNANRGFFFSHIGWQMVRPHPEVLRKREELDLSDLYADPFVRVQKKYYWILMPLVCFIVPAITSVYFCNESWLNAFLVVGFFRYITLLHMTCLVNSAAHMWGNKPYDKFINPTQNISVSMFTLGEGYHNYHHTFPSDYKASELKLDYLNFTTQFINFFSMVNWAYDLRTASDDVIRKKIKKTGDGSCALSDGSDKYQPQDEIKNVLQ